MYQDQRDEYKKKFQEKEEEMLEKSNKMESLLEENEKLIQILENNTSDLKKYQDQYNALNQNHENYIEEIKRQFEIQKEVILTQKIQEKMKEFLEEKSLIENNYEKAKIEREDFKNKSEKLVDEYEKLNLVLIEKIKENEEMSLKIAKIENLENEVKNTKLEKKNLKNEFETQIEKLFQVYFNNF